MKKASHPDKRTMAASEPRVVENQLTERAIYAENYCV